VAQNGFGVDWSYVTTLDPNQQPFQPTFWGALSQTNCAARLSPIDLTVADTNHQLSCRSLVVDFPALPQVNLTNNGSSLFFQVNDPNQFVTNGIPIALARNAQANLDCASGNYLLERVVFYFNQVNGTKGTQHTLDGQSGDLEVSFMYYHANQTGTPPIIGLPSHLSINVLYLAQADPAAANPGLQSVVNVIGLLKNQGDNTTAPVDVRGLLPENVVIDYFLYDGTQTSPNCSANVRQLTFATFHKISQAQLTELRTLTRAPFALTGEVGPQPLAPNVANVENAANVFVYRNIVKTNQKIYVFILPTWILTGIYLSFLFLLLGLWGAKHYNKKQ